MTRAKQLPTPDRPKSCRSEPYWAAPLKPWREPAETHIFSVASVRSFCQLISFSRRECFPARTRSPATRAISAFLMLRRTESRRKRV